MRDYTRKMHWREWLFLAVVIILYGIVAFYNLGDPTAPQTYAVIDNQSGPLYFEVAEAPASVALYCPVNSSTKYIDITISASSNQMDWSVAFDTDDDSKDYTAAMIWYDYPLSCSGDTRYIRVDKHAASNRLVLAEIGFYNQEGKLIPTKALSPNGGLVLDEPQTISRDSNRMNSAYFDESYFPSSALEMQDGLSVAEMDHPPVGRLIIGLGMDLWGRNPFGFRFMQVFSGILMLPLLYFFGRSLLKSPKWAGMVTLLLALDFMHYTQTRIGTLDAFLVLFILGMYAFMVFYHNSQCLWRRYLFLLLSGVCAGCAIGTKWSGLYAAAGLALLYFFWLFQRIRFAWGIERRAILYECTWCILCFIMIPCLVYGLSYIPYAQTLGRSDFYTVAIEHAKQMLSYHTGTSTNYNHPYSSHWWTWFLALKPVFYYFEPAPANIYLYATGNPLVWGFGLVGSFYALWRGIRRLDDAGIVIAAAYFSQLIPWIFITRDTFLYHYFPMVPFLMLALGYFFQNTCTHPRIVGYRNIFISIYLCAVGISFVVAFPFIYGSGISWETILGIRLAFQISALLFGVLYVGLLLRAYRLKGREIL